NNGEANIYIKIGGTRFVIMCKDWKRAIDKLTSKLLKLQNSSDPFSSSLIPLAQSSRVYGK
ncbi:1220_t:CDS:2, partial [Dentiscutata heterogama]